MADVVVEGGSGPPLVDPEKRERVELNLYHVHFPMLSEAGLLTYDAESGAVERRSLAKRTRDVIRFAYWYDRFARGEESGFATP